MSTAQQEKQEKIVALPQAGNRFSSNLSHELRTPLNSIIGFAEFLSGGKPGPVNAKQKEYLGDILTSGRRLLQLIDDLHDLAKVEAGRMALMPDSFALLKAIEDVCGVAKPFSQKKRIHVMVAVTPELGQVTLDRQKFKQVLYNLLANAIAFTADGGSVDIAAAPHGPQHFKLAVRDTGVGIKPEDIRRLFTEFDQFESGAPRHFEGTGLGLALTRRIVELCHGSIAVTSEIGKGSTFTVTLPLVTKGGKP